MVHIARTALSVIARLEGGGGLLLALSEGMTTRRQVKAGSPRCSSSVRRVQTLMYPSYPKRFLSPPIIPRTLVALEVRDELAPEHLLRRELRGHLAQCYEKRRYVRDDVLPSVLG